LLLDAAREFGISLDGVAFIGDKQSDVDAAIAVGARPMLVGDRVAAGCPADVERYPDLAAAARALIESTGES
jgi:D-glycero-D-manno-heptose 1,7-bisphosphate phosphatase